jgi:MFS transporter, Spinster family, sphingosine-1-phosphate transporter
MREHQGALVENVEAQVGAIVLGRRGLSTGWKARATRTRVVARAGFLHHLLVADRNVSDNEAGRRSQTRMVLVLLFLLMVLDYADRQVMVAAFPYLRSAWGVSDVALGALVSVVSVMMAAAALPIALVVDRWGRVRAIVVMAIVWSAATAACGFAGGFLSMLTARFVVGLGQAGFGSAGSALLAAKIAAERRASALGVFQTGAPVGIVVGGVGGVVAAAQWGWRAAFWVLALPGLVLAVLFLRVRDYPTVRPARSGARAAAGALLRARSAVGAMVGGALLLVVLSTLYTWLPTYLQRVYGMAPARAGVLGSVVVLAGALGTAGGGVLADWAARRDVRRRLIVPALAAVLTSALLGTAFLALPVGAAQLLLILAGGATVTAAVGPAAAGRARRRSAGSAGHRGLPVRCGPEPVRAGHRPGPHRRARRQVGPGLGAERGGGPRRSRGAGAVLGVAFLPSGPESGREPAAGPPPGGGWSWIRFERTDRSARCRCWRRCRVPVYPRTAAAHPRHNTRGRGGRCAAAARHQCPGGLTMLTFSIGLLDTDEVDTDKVDSRVSAMSSTPNCSSRAIIPCNAAPSTRTPRSSVSVAGSAGLSGSSAARMSELSRPRTRKVYSLLTLASRSPDTTGPW